MTAGLPGTGIGGLFYFLMVFAMPVRETVRTFQKQSSLARWKFIGLQVGFVVAILAGMYGEAWLLNMFVLWLQETLVFKFLVGHSVVWQLTFQKAQAFAFASGSAAFMSLAFVYIAMHVIRLIVHRKPAVKSEVSTAVKAA